MIDFLAMTAVLIMDDGVGIFQKIKDHFGFDSLDDAIGELFKGKLTTDTENHSGVSASRHLRIHVAVKLFSKETARSF